MTETLKHALHDQATAPSFDPVDLATIHRDGDRTLRRRRVGLVAGGAVAAAAVVATALTVLPGADGSADGTPVANDPAGTADVTWVEGSTLHRANGPDLDLGRPAVAYVRTSVGYVFADDGGTIYSVEDGGVLEVGSTDPESIRLVSDPDEPRAAWLDVDRSGVVSYDQSSGADVTLLERFTDGDTTLTALDGTTAYVAVARQARSIDLVSGETAVVARNGSEVLDATDGVLALGDDSGIRLSTSRSDGADLVLRGDYADVGTFSPDGAWFSSDADQPQVVSTATGEPLDIDAPEFFATGYEWLDDRTLVMIAQDREADPLVLLTCQVPAGTCSQVGQVEDPDRLQIPLGLPISR